MVYISYLLAFKNYYLQESMKIHPSTTTTSVPPSPCPLLALLQSVERIARIRICYHDYLRAFTIPYQYTVHESAPCLAIKKDNMHVCTGFCGADGTVDRTVAESKSGWVHKCPFGRLKIAVPVRHEECLAGVLFAELIARVEDDGSDENKSVNMDLSSMQPARTQDLLHLLEAVATRIERLLESAGYPDTLTREEQPERKTNAGSRRGTVLSYIERNLCAAPDLAGLGAALNLSPSRAGHLVQELFRKSFSQLLAAARANRAALLLAATGYTPSEIALRLGYTDQSHFTRAFRRHFATTPAAYRRQSHRG